MHTHTHTHTHAHPPNPPKPPRTPAHLNTPFFISPAYSVPSMTISRCFRLMLTLVDDVM
jgi:hypothetical protein